MKIVLALTLITLLAAPFSLAQSTSLEVLGVQVTNKGYGKGFADGFSDLRAFNSEKATRVALLIKSSSGGIIAFDKKKSHLTSFTDSQGNSLLDPKNFQDGLNAFPKISKDGKALLVEIQGSKTPATGSNSIRASGKFEIISATQKQTYKTELIELKEGQVLKAGPIPFTIGSAEKPKWGDAELQVKLKTSQDLTNLATVEFFNSQGEKLESSKGGSSSISLGGIIQESRSYNLKKSST